MAGMTPEAIAAMATAAAAGGGVRGGGTVSHPRPSSPNNHARRPRRGGERRKSDTFVTSTDEKPRRRASSGALRRGSVSIDSRTGRYRQRFGISKHHVEIFNKQLDRDEPERYFVKSLLATGTINLGELSEVGGDAMLGYPDGNNKGETRSFMLALSM